MEKVTLNQKRGMVSYSHKCLVFVLLFVLLAFPSLADQDTGVTCQNEPACRGTCVINYNRPETDCYCSAETRTCFLKGDVSAAPMVQQPAPQTTPSHGQTVPTPGAAVAPTAAIPAPIPVQEQVEFINLQQRIGFVESQATTVQERLAVIESAVNALQEQITQLSTGFQQLQTGAQNLQFQQEKDSLELGGRIQTVSTGLAGLQENLESTQTDLTTLEEDLAKNKKLTTITSTIFYTLLVVVAALITYYYLQRKKAGELSPEAIRYITAQIKHGKKYAHIRDYLKTAGWSEEDIAVAYKETMRQNYQQYLEHQPTGTMAGSPVSPLASARSSSAPVTNARKTAIIAGVSLLVVVGLFFIFQGVTTGKAIHFTSERELDIAALDLLKRYVVPNTELVPLISYANVCIEVRDLEQVAAFRFIKTPTEYSIDPVDGSCGDATYYDASIKFTNWNAFNSVARRMTCDSFRGASKIKSEDGVPGVYILPSRLVQPGFTLAPDADVSRFCPVLKACLTLEELQKAGIMC